MVKLKGPLLSLEASGTIADTLTIQEWKGRTYMRKKPQPADAKSGKQIGMRAMFSYLTKHWDSISSIDKATWNTRAASKNILPFNAYLNENLLRWVTGKHPGEAFPIGETGTSAVTLFQNAIPQGTGLRVQLGIQFQNDNQGATLHRILDPPSLTRLDNAIQVLPSEPAPSALMFFDHPLEPGIHWYKWAGFTNDGKAEMIGAPFSGTVT